MFATRRTAASLGQAARHQRSWAYLVLALLAALLVLCSGCGTRGASKGAVTPVAQAPSVQRVRVHLAPTPTISTTVRIAQRHLYPFARTNVGLMQPAVDAQGTAWIGEMHANSLGRLNSKTGAVTSWTPPGAQYGIMTTTVDASGDAWFAEQNANYIGYFAKKQQTFHIFPLGMWKGSPLGPQDLQFDSKGFLWFTAGASGVIGRLDPTTGTIRLWPLPSYASCLTVASNGLIWFGDVTDDALGTLDPLTGKVTLYDLPNPQTQIFSMTTDTSGRLWFTEVLPGRLGMFDPATSTLTELPVPAMAGTPPPALYTLVIDHQGHIWFVDVGANALVRYVPGSLTLTFFQLSLPSSAPFGLALDPSGRLWFTAGGSSANYVGEMAP
jgi:virginiamycin B lyase